MNNPLVIITSLLACLYLTGLIIGIIQTALKR